MSEARTIPAKYIFLNIVGFTHNRSVEAQADIIQALNSIVESVVKEFGVTREDVLFLPSGDGLCVALLNIESPYDIHLQIALNIIREVSRHNARTQDKMRKFEVHVGLNAYTDNFITDINGNRNIAGTGVSTAARVMSRADGNQILVSQAVYEALHYHEKYLASFRGFKTKLENNQEFSVYQFIAPGHEGLNTAIPQSLQTAIGIEPPVKPAIPADTSRIGKVEFNKPSVPAATLPAIPEISLPETQSTQTHSYLTGILAEQQAKNESQKGWIKPKPESKTFLEEVVPQKNNHTLLWAALLLLILGGAGFAAWMFSGSAPAESISNTATEISGKTPANTPASSSTVLPTPTPNQTIAENAPKSDQSFAPKTPAPETKAASETKLKARRTISPRAETRRTVQPAAVKTTAPEQPKQQTANSEKPKASKKVTLDDLINNNK